eukprot:scaffold115210_cov54-Phaeocystis_antarctica.AAC.2
MEKDCNRWLIPVVGDFDSEWGKYLKLMYGDISRLRYPFIFKLHDQPQSKALLGTYSVSSLL